MYLVAFAGKSAPAYRHDSFYQLVPQFTVVPRGASSSTWALQPQRPEAIGYFRYLEFLQQTCDGKFRRGQQPATPGTAF